MVVGVNSSTKDGPLVNSMVLDKKTGYSLSMINIIYLGISHHINSRDDTSDPWSARSDGGVHMIWLAMNCRH
jgi:hypothetical protein